MTLEPSANPGYLFVNILLILVSIFLGRRVFIVFGGIGTFTYLAFIAYEFFEDSLLFPFVLSPHRDRHHRAWDTLSKEFSEDQRMDNSIYT